MPEQKRLICIVPRHGAFVSNQSENRWQLQVTGGLLETAAHAPDVAMTISVLEWREGLLPDTTTHASVRHRERLASASSGCAFWADAGSPFDQLDTHGGRPDADRQASAERPAIAACHPAWRRTSGLSGRREAAAVIPPPRLPEICNCRRIFWCC